MRLKETPALTPTLSPRRGGSTHSSWRFSRPLVRHCFMGTYVGSYKVLESSLRAFLASDQVRAESPSALLVPRCLKMVRCATPRRLPDGTTNTGRERPQKAQEARKEKVGGRCDKLG